jgi:hypothetical protein
MTCKCENCKCKFCECETEHKVWVDEDGAALKRCARCGRKTKSESESVE